MWHAKVYPLGETPNDFLDTLSPNPSPSPPQSSSPSPPPSSSPSPPPSLTQSPGGSPSSALPPKGLPPPPPPSPAQSPPPAPPLPPPWRSTSPKRQPSSCLLSLFPWCSAHEYTDEECVGGKCPGTPPHDYQNSSDNVKAVESRDQVVPTQVSGTPDHPAEVTQFPSYHDYDVRSPRDAVKEGIMGDISGSSERLKTSSTKSKYEETLYPSSATVDRPPEELVPQKSSKRHADAGDPQSGSARKATVTSEDMFFDTAECPCYESPSHLPSLRGDSASEQTTVTSLRHGLSPKPTSQEMKGTPLVAPEDLDGGTLSELSPLIPTRTAFSQDGGPRGRLADLVDDLMNAARSLDIGEEDENEEDNTLVRRDDDGEKQ